jgi:hypothetical protein
VDKLDDIEVFARWSSLEVDRQIIFRGSYNHSTQEVEVKSLGIFFQTFTEKIENLMQILLSIQYESFLKVERTKSWYK